MFLLLPTLWIVIVYIVAAVLPAVLLMRYVYRQDRIEKEPTLLLLTLIGMGVLAALASIVLEMAGELLLSLGSLDPESPLYLVLLSFLVVAVVEEGTKLLLLKWRSWRNPNFNYRFDGVVYSVFVSLGFAAFENIQYVMGYGLSVVVPRALLAIPGHMSFAVFMGVFYGRAKVCEKRGDRAGKAGNLLLGYLIAVLLHGFYDACAMIGNTLSTILFLVFVAVLFLCVFRVIRKQAASDREL